MRAIIEYSRKNNTDTDHVEYNLQEHISSHVTCCMQLGNNEYITKNIELAAKTMRKLSLVSCIELRILSFKALFLILEPSKAIIRLIATEKSTPIRPYRIFSVISVGCNGISDNTMQTSAAIIIRFITIGLIQVQFAYS